MEIFVSVPYVYTQGSGNQALGINYDSDWIVNGVASTAVKPVGNTIIFGQVTSPSGTSLTTNGYSGVGNNIFLGGQVISGAITITSASDVANYMTGGAWTTIGRFYSMPFVRSGGSFAFPDIYGDGTHIMWIAVGDAPMAVLGLMNQ